MKTARAAKKSSAKTSSRKVPAKKAAAVARKAAGTRKGTGRKGAARKGPQRTAARGRSPDALALLIQDHREAQKLFRKAGRLDADDAALAEIVRTACAALTLHAQVEEDVFYPAMRAEADADDLLDEAEVEHDVAKDLIAQLGKMRGGERMKATFKVLGEYVNHHVEEEENELFPKARRAKMDLAALGERIAARKAEGPQETAPQGEGEASARAASSAGGRKVGTAKGAASKRSTGGRKGSAAPSGSGRVGEEREDLEESPGAPAVSSGDAEGHRRGRGNAGFEDEEASTGGEDEDVERAGGRESPGRAGA